jgi:hypothetical protein
MIQKFLQRIQTIKIIWVGLEAEVELRTTVGRPVCLGVGYSIAAMTRFFLSLSSSEDFLSLNWCALSEQRTSL